MAIDGMFASYARFEAHGSSEECSGVVFDLVRGFSTRLRCDDGDADGGGSNTNSDGSSSFKTAIFKAGSSSVVPELEEDHDHGSVESLGRFWSVESADSFADSDAETVILAPRPNSTLSLAICRQGGGDGGDGEG